MLGQSVFGQELERVWAAAGLLTLWCRKMRAEPSQVRAVTQGWLWKHYALEGRAPTQKLERYLSTALWGLQWYVAERGAQALHHRWLDQPGFADWSEKDFPEGMEAKGLPWGLVAVRERWRRWTAGVSKSRPRQQPEQPPPVSRRTPAGSPTRAPTAGPPRRAAAPTRASTVEGPEPAGTSSGGSWTPCLGCQRRLRARATPPVSEVCHGCGLPETTGVRATVPEEEPREIPWVLVMIFKEDSVLLVQEGDRDYRLPGGPRRHDETDEQCGARWVLFLAGFHCQARGFATLARGLAYRDYRGDRAMEERHTTVLLYVDTKDWSWRPGTTGSVHFAMESVWVRPAVALERPLEPDMARWVYAASVLVHYRRPAPTRRMVQAVVMRGESVLLVRQDNGVYRLPEGVWEVDEGSRVAAIRGTAEETGIFLPPDRLSILERDEARQAPVGGGYELPQGATYFAKLRDDHPDPPSRENAALARSFGTEEGGQEGRGAWVPLLVVTDLRLARTATRGVFEVVRKLRAGRGLSPMLEQNLGRLRNLDGSEPPSYPGVAGSPAPPPSLDDLRLEEPLVANPQRSEAQEMILHAMLGTRGPRLSFGEDDFAIASIEEVNAVTSDAAGMRVHDGIHLRRGLEEPEGGSSSSSGEGRAGNEETLRSFAQYLTRATPKRTTHTFGSLLPRLTRHVRLMLLRVGYRGFDAQYIARRLLDMSPELRSKVLASKKDFRARVHEIERYRRSGSRHAWEQRLQLLEDPDSYLSGGSDDVSSGSSMEEWEDGLSEAQVSLVRNFGEIALAAELEERRKSSKPSSAYLRRWHPGCGFWVILCGAVTTWALWAPPSWTSWDWIPAA